MSTLVGQEEGKTTTLLTDIFTITIDTSKMEEQSPKMLLSALNKHQWIDLHPFVQTHLKAITNNKHNN